MELDQSIETLLDAIKKNSERCLKTNENARNIISRFSRNAKENHQRKVKPDQDKLIREDSGSTKDLDETDALTNFFRKKEQENVRLKEINESLLLSSLEKTDKIKKMQAAVMMYHPQTPKDKEISYYKEKIGRCNVETQRLKQQISIAKKKLQVQKSRESRLHKHEIRSLSGEKSPSFEETFKKNKIRPQQESAKVLFKELDDVYLQKTLMIIKLNSESAINDETLEDLEVLESDEDEMSSGETDFLLKYHRKLD